MKLDHLAIIAPSLEEGAAHVRTALGIDMPAGGKHGQMGTHNLLLRIGDAVFLEVIALDPDAPAPRRPRWFGLDDADTVRAEWDAGRRLRSWIAQADDLDAVMVRHAGMLGEKIAVSRGDRSWEFIVTPDGSLPMGGAAPPVIDWGQRGNPAPDMPDLGVKLVSFQIEHPEPDRVRGIYADLGIIDPPEVMPGARLRYRAIIQTPDGVRELT